MPSVSRGTSEAIQSAFSVRKGINGPETQTGDT